MQGERSLARVWVGRELASKMKEQGAAQEVWWLGGGGRKKMNHFWTFWPEDTR